MFSFETIQKFQPIDLGFIYHCGRWATSPNNDIIIENPNFKVENPEDEVEAFFSHGTFDRSKAFFAVAQGLLDNKLPACVSRIILVNYEQRGFGIGIKEFAEQLIKKMQVRKVKKAVLYGHSRGGAVSAYATEYLAEEAGITILGVGAVGTPFLGSSFAMAPLSWFFKSVKEMEKNSPFLANLTDRIRRSKAKYYYFAGSNDYLVPITSACLEQTTKSATIIDGLGHLAVMSSPRLIDHIARSLFAMTKPRTSDSSPSVARANEEMVATLLNEMRVEEENQHPIHAIYKEIEFEMIKLLNRIHMRSPNEKLKVLDKFKNNLILLLEPDNNIETYNARTLAEYMFCFLNDAKNNEGKSGFSILSEPLNYTLCFFPKPKPESHKFVDRLIEKHKATPMPERGKKLALTNAID